MQTERSMVLLDLLDRGLDPLGHCQAGALIHWGFRIADCGILFGIQSAVRNPQSAIRGCRNLGSGEALAGVEQEVREIAQPLGITQPAEGPLVDNGPVFAF